MPKIPRVDHTVAYFGKHKGLKWEEVAEDDPMYIRWLLTWDCPVTLTSTLYEYLEGLAEEYGIL